MEFNEHSVPSPAVLLGTCTTHSCRYTSHVKESHKNEASNTDQGALGSILTIICDTFIQALRHCVYSSVAMGIRRKYYATSGFAIRNKVKFVHPRKAPIAFCETPTWGGLSLNFISGITHYIIQIMHNI